MSDDAAGSATAERGLANSATEVASFDEERKGLIRTLQGVFHDYPTLIPLIVLVAASAAFTFAAPGRFLSPLNLSLVLQQVTTVAILGMAQTLVILTAGIDLSVGLIMILCSVVMGRLAVVYGVPVVLAFPIGLLAGVACGLVNAAAPAAVHRDAGHMEHLRRTQQLRFGQRNDPLGGHGCGGAIPAVAGQTVQALRHWNVLPPRSAVSQGLGGDVWLAADDRAGGADVVHADADRVWPPHLCDRRRSRCGAALGHQHQPGAAGGLHAGGAHLRCSGVVADRTRRRREPAGGPDGQPRFDHRRGDRRHQLVRRAWLDRRDDLRGADRGRVPQRPLARGARAATAAWWRSTMPAST
jgi:hypothetical protein